MVMLVIFVLGITLGSFVNALVWRLHEQLNEEGETKKLSKTKKAELSILKGRSLCPSCGHQLASKDLVPVLSWLSLRGKCRYCHKPISVQYPLVEVVSGALFAFSYTYWPLAWNGQGKFEFAVWLVVLTGLIALFIYDLKWMLLPNRIIYPLFGLVGLLLIARIFVFDGGLDSALEAVWGFGIGGGLFYVIFIVSGGKWIGGGDVKLGWLLGLLVGGPLASILMLFIASLLGTLVSVPLLLSGKLSRKTPMPFGPFLIGAAFIAQLFGASVIAWYKRQLGL